MKEKKEFTATIIKGNPKFIKGNQAARLYYLEIVRYLKSKGAIKVNVDPGADFTTPPKADIYIGHSKGIARYKHMDPKEQKRFLKFGSLDGYIHPVDAEWLKKWEAGEDIDKIGPPPKEHYFFIKEQRKAIDDLVDSLD